ncbi:hypothetical protein PQR14_13215 [Paraburkholderia bryophila]|uniref:hypothetical protein n=1 Tax=Paraburkholderia bryophila TaxID=420952 RepID=UPI0038B851DF
MIQKNHQSGFAAFADAFGGIFKDIVDTKYVVAEQKKHESKRERQPIRVETRARLTGVGVREIVKDKIDELADFGEVLLLEQREMLERRDVAQLDQLSKIVALVSQMQGATGSFGTTTQGGERG